MKKEKIQYCLEFAKGSYYARFPKAKNSNFPESLLCLTKEQEHIMELWDKGLTKAEIARQIGVSRPSVFEIIERVNKKRQFYYDWIEFWNFISPILDTKIFFLFGMNLTDSVKKHYAEERIETLGDYLRFCVTHTTRDVNLLLGEDITGVERRVQHYQKIQEFIFEKYKEKLED